MNKENKKMRYKKYFFLRFMNKNMFSPVPPWDLRLSHDAPSRHPRHCHGPSITDWTLAIRQPRHITHGIWDTQGRQVRLCPVLCSTCPGHCTIMVHCTGVTGPGNGRNVSPDPDKWQHRGENNMMLLARDNWASKKYTCIHLRNWVEGMESNQIMNVPR